MRARAAATAGVSRTRDRSSGASAASRASGVRCGMPPVYIITMPEANQRTNRRLTGIPT